MNNTKLTLDITIIFLLLIILVLTFKNQNNRGNIENVIKTTYNMLFTKKIKQNDIIYDKNKNYVTYSSHEYDFKGIISY